VLLIYFQFWHYFVFEERKCALDESLLHACPTALRKEPTIRGDFDLVQIFN